MIQEHKKMNEYLNKQINEKAIGIRPFASTSYSYSPQGYGSTVSNFANTTETSRIKFSNPIMDNERVDKLEGNK